MTAGGLASVEIAAKWTASFYLEIPSGIGEKAEETGGGETKGGCRLLLGHVKESGSFEEEKPAAEVIWEAEARCGAGDTADHIDLSERRLETDFPDRLNSAGYFEDGVLEEDSTQSVAGRIYRSLSERDSSWIHDIYNLRQISVQEMAERLGVEVPTIKEWTRVNIRFYNGDGAPVSGYSNAKEILSMASVYGYFHQWEDYDSLYQYADRMWGNSHSYTVSVSDFYFCDGDCQYIDSDLESEPSAEGDSARTPDMQGDQTEEAPAGDQGLTESAQARQEIGPGVESTASMSEGVAEGEESTEAGPGVGQPETVDLPEGGGASETAGQLEGGGALEDAGQQGDGGESESAGQQGGGGESGGAGQPANTEEQGVYDKSPETVGEGDETKACQGHMDLNVSARIIGLKEAEDLFAVDAMGGREDSELWKGWDSEMEAYARSLEEQDWYALYGLTASDSMYVRNPLTSSEISFYLKLLPKEISPKRREVVKQALLSVGCIPYYWGGKPYGGGYESNGFGTVTVPDEDGRILRGLDCSGWINWVYWTALGSSLPAESTSGLINCGRGISKEELQAGDLLIRSGEERHVYMFLAWAEDGSMYLIHETTGTFNNVTINTYDLDVPHYRSLINEE